MAETRQPHLNGAYYGPNIPPPPTKAYHRPGRGSGCCCNPFSCCCSCLMNCICTCIFQVICTILVILAVVIFVLWLIFRPNAVKFHATNATLSQFSHDTNNNTLHYNLLVNISIRNPNKRIGIYYDRIEATAFYEGERFGYHELQTFYQGHKTTNNVTAEFVGTQLVPLAGQDLTKFNSDTTARAYDIDVKLRLRIRLKVWFVKTMRWKPKIDCDLRIPLNGAGAGAGTQTFQPKRCDFDWR